jgi:hypothetical protein
MSDPTKIILPRSVFPLTECGGHVGNILVIENDPLPSLPTPPTPAFSNIEKSIEIQRNDCAAGKVGTTVKYTVPAGKYTSEISQAEADALAQADIDKNAQAYANVNGSCELKAAYKNEKIAQMFYKKTCAGVGNFPILGTTYTVPAGKYESWISQADANAKAQADVIANGQAYADNLGTCTYASGLVKINLDCDIDIDFKLHYWFTHNTSFSPIVCRETLGSIVRTYHEAIIKKSDFPVYIYKTTLAGSNGTNNENFLARFLMSEMTTQCKVGFDLHPEWRDWVKIRQNATTKPVPCYSGGVMNIVNEVTLLIRSF